MSNRGDFPVYEPGYPTNGYAGRGTDESPSQTEADLSPGGAIEEAEQPAFSSVLHELRVPLTAVLGYAKLLDDERVGKVNATQRRYLRNILENGRRMVEALDGLSELDAKRGRRSELVDFGGLWSESVRLTRPRAAIRGIRIVERPREGRLMVSGDRDDLAFAANKVLANAVRATAPGGTVELTVARESAEVTARITSVEAGDAESAQAAILGCGRWSGCPTQAGANTAVQGMPLVHDIIETHAGRIWSTGSPDSGWTLALSLPAAGRDT